jgi:antitoxin component YwqK of YwqJK toxin-antitoxin module
MIRFLLLLSIAAISCKNNSDRKFRITIKDGITTKGYVIKDTVFDDTVLYYDQRNILIRKDYFKNGKIDGVSIDYFPNGRPMKIINYRNGLKNGYSAYYDSSGKCYYEDFYYYDLIVGPVVYKDEQEYPRRFFFVNLQNETLMDIDYQNWNGVEKLVPYCVNYVYNRQRKDSIDEMSLFLYLIKPPKMSFEYSVLKRNKNIRNYFSEVLKVKNDAPFVNLILETLPDSLYYSVRLSVYDSIQNKKTVIDKEIW